MRAMAVLRVLVVDDDAWTFQIVKSVLSRRGHVVHQATSVEAAQSSLRLLLPDVVLCDPAPLPAASLAAFLRRVRDSDGLNEPAAPRTGAVVLLSALPPDEERLRLLPAEGYLQKPFRFAELDAVLDQAVQRRRGFVRERAASGAATLSGVHGSLDQLSLASLLTMIEMERKSGILLLRRGSQSARLYCRDGRVIAARLFAATTLSGIDVVYKLLTWTEGHFDFTSMPVSVPSELAPRQVEGALHGASPPGPVVGTSGAPIDSEFDIPITHLLLESARRRDESQTEPADSHPGA
jgi:DNA-binding response OmpR family regulator